MVIRLGFSHEEAWEKTPSIVQQLQLVSNDVDDKNKIKLSTISQNESSQ